MRNSSWVSLVLIAIFIAPFFALDFFLPKIENPFDADFFSVLGLSFAQALVSSALILCFGFFAALGLTGMQNRTLRKLLDLILLWPSFVPALLILVSTLNIFMIFARFPFGFWGVVIVHVLINTGLVAVLIARRLENEMGGIVEVATIEGAGRWAIIKAIALEMAAELANLFYFVFVLCFTSFSVPLIVGAQSGRTLETLIYQKLVASHEAGAALPLSLIQIVVLLLLASRVVPPTGFLSRHFRQTKRIGFKPVLSIFAFASVILTIGASRGLLTAFKQMQENPFLSSRLVSGAWGTALECFFVSLFTLILCFLACAGNMDGDSLSNRFFRSYAAPSAAVLGLSLVLCFSPETWPNISLLALLAFGFTLLIFATLFRMRLSAALSALRPQIETARVLGATPFLILKSVMLPLLKGDFVFIAGLAAFWASGDFAFASMVAGRDVTLAISAHTLLGGYRLEAATLVTILSLIIGAIFFLGLEWLGSPCAVEVPP